MVDNFTSKEHIQKINQLFKLPPQNINKNINVNNPFLCPPKIPVIVISDPSTIFHNNKISETIPKNSEKSQLTNIFPMNEEEKLYQYMGRYKIKTDNKVTHSIIKPSYGAYSIPKQAYPEFAKLYINAIVAGYNLSIIENGTYHDLIYIDLEFRHNSNIRFYQGHNITDIIDLYNKLIQKYLKIDNITAYIMEKSIPCDKLDYYSDGIHIIYPYHCSKTIQLQMRKDFILLCKINNVFRNIALINDLESMFDVSSVCCNRMMYGSSGGDPESIYYVTRIYNYINSKLSIIKLSSKEKNQRDIIHFFVDIFHLAKNK